MNHAQERCKELSRAWSSEAHTRREMQGTAADRGQHQLLYCSKVLNSAKQRHHPCITLIILHADSEREQQSRVTVQHHFLTYSIVQVEMSTYVHDISPR